jgi:glycerate 2-kinase
MKSQRHIAEYLFRTAIEAVNPFEAVRSQCATIRAEFRERGCNRLIGLAFGKAAVPMALAVEEELHDLLDTGIAITKYGHTAPTRPDKFILFEAGHPVPDSNGLHGSAALMALAATADADTLALVLISGGGSALLVAPASGIPLTAKQKTTDLLLRSGAEIHQLNTVRKHMSRVKGGRLAQLLYPARTISLILSDVIGDDLDVIASGPTAADPSTFRDALNVLTTHNLTEQLSPETRSHLLRGTRGEEEETPKQGNPLFRLVTNKIIASNATALTAALSAAQQNGLQAECHVTPLTGEACEAGQMLARIALARQATATATTLCLISGGETTVTVHGTGNGGRNMELALAFAMDVAGCPGISLLSAGTDGTDGPTDAAGAFVDGQTITPLNRDQARHCLENNDSYRFFHDNGGLFKTGPTGTNVMDLQLVLIDAYP